MTFANWKHKSKLYQSFKNRAERNGIAYEEVAQAAYKAGERAGRQWSPTGNVDCESTAQSVACPTDKEK